MDISMAFRIASFDIGKRNFAFAVVDFWDGPQRCLRTANKSTRGEGHDLGGLRFEPVALEHADLDRYVFMCHQCGCRASKWSQTTLRGTCLKHLDPTHRHVDCRPFSPTYSMFNFLDRFIPLLKSCNLVLIERQPGKSKWQEELCRGIEFYMYLRRIPVEVHYFRTVTKLSILPPITERDKARRYRAIKDETETICRGWLADGGHWDALEYLDMMGIMFPGRAIDCLDSLFNAIVFRKRGG